MNLFDIADDVYHYKDIGTSKPSSAPAVLSSNTTVPTLLLLDETLQHLHKARDKTTPQLNLPTKQPCAWKYSSKHIENEPRKPLRNVFSNSLLEPKVIDAPPNNPLREMGGKVVIVNQSDDTAKGLLKAVTEACEAFERANHPDKLDELIQTLELKLATLNTLASTPFVALVRKKIDQKLTTYKLPPKELKETKNNDLEAFGNDIKATLKSLKSTSNSSPHHPQTHPNQSSTTILDKLMKLPKSQLERLPKAQQELVEFSKRYQQVLSLPSDKLAQLPLHQQQLVVQLRNKK
ncbi:hypothetical protein THRCLA_20224 [Thraustotheca clavata]|uniref:Uncharacterized protein n=1 Tax=Thraustotheca clavata TaxID=74557 RepID=A0A1W0AA47_9STRA|nr:hypothetical protein THRCLA_20224 [Thraustotheca clavata]